MRFSFGSARAWEGDGALAQELHAQMQLEKWSLGDPRMHKLAARSTSLWFSATFVVQVRFRYITRPKSTFMRVTRQLMLPPSTVT